MSYSDQHYGAGNPSCQICQGLGYIRYDVPENHAFFGKIFECSCRSLEQDISRQSFLRRVGGLAHLEDKTFESFHVDTAHPKDIPSLKEALTAATQFADHPSGWLVITGSYGCGKTHLAAAIANNQIMLGNRAVFITAPDLLDHLRSSFSSNIDSENGYEARFEEIKSAAILILDDLGTESPTAWAQEKLYQLLNFRYMAQLPTVITTNHDLNDIEPRLRSRLLDRMLCRQIHITARDYRLSQDQDSANDPTGLRFYREMVFKKFDFRQSDLTKDQRDNLQRAFKLAQEYALKPQGWLILMGAYATGKTFLAAAIGNLQDAQGASVLFITVPDLLDHLRSTFAPNSNTSYDKLFSEIKSVPLLILDDLSVESATPWAREKLHQILNFRFNAKLPTVITTSHTDEELEDGDSRLAARLRANSNTRIFELQVPAYRGERQKTMP